MRKLWAGPIAPQLGARRTGRCRDRRVAGRPACHRHACIPSPPCGPTQSTKGSHHQNLTRIHAPHSRPLWQAEAGGALPGADAAAGAAAQAAALLEADRLLAEQLAEADAVDENLKDFMAEYDDEQEGDEFEDFDSPAVDY